MTLILKIAWRNIWRSRTRSFVVIGSIIMAIWALIFLMGFFQGQVSNYISNIIDNETSHIQIHDSLFKADYNVQLYIPDALEITEKLGTNPQIKAVTSRTIMNAMISSSATVQGVMVKGVNIEAEDKVTNLPGKIIEGTAFESDLKNQILISQRMADKLKVKLRSKIVLTFQDIERNISTGAFRVTGIYKTSNKISDELYVFTQKEDMTRLMGMPNEFAHEIAILVNNFDLTDTIAYSIQSEFFPNKVETYKEISPDLELFNSQIQVNMIIMTVIFMLAIIFGIINTMLMAVLERIRELGMLMAVGMNKVRVFFMVVFETIFIALLGAPFGLILGYLTVLYFNEYGIDLSRWNKGMEEFGLADIVRPTLEPDAFLIITVGIIVTSVLASIYPAMKAINLKPVEALRKI